MHYRSENVGDMALIHEGALMWALRCGFGSEGREIYLGFQRCWTLGRVAVGIRNNRMAKLVPLRADEFSNEASKSCFSEGSFELS